ncbi:hypothetical protein BHECKSOX_1210 [Bathymodiolus heckerae thiotrophic gill symbiont]|nr:hypothetical protein BHECKSOX_1210 [Bathymodiolus heckerae thiotrophic gill symbiont]
MLREPNQDQKELLNRLGSQISVNEIMKTLPGIRHHLSLTGTRKVINTTLATSIAILLGDGGVMCKKLGE